MYVDWYGYCVHRSGDHVHYVEALEHLKSGTGYQGTVEPQYCTLHSLYMQYIEFQDADKDGIVPGDLKGGTWKPLNMRSADPILGHFPGVFADTC